MNKSLIVILGIAVAVVALFVLRGGTQETVVAPEESGLNQEEVSSGEATLPTETVDNGSSEPSDSSTQEPPTEEPQEEQESSQPVVGISYTDNGYEPSSVTVAAGTSVTFVNNSSRQMWPASAVHPVHQDLPGFDALRSIDSGGQYTYTFEKVGAWRFHDHLRPGFTGTVIVE